MATGTIIFLLLIICFYGFSGFLLVWSVKSAAKRSADEVEEQEQTAENAK